MSAGEPWIEWAGGECPVDADAPVQIRCRCGYESHSELLAGAKHLQKFWRHDKRYDEANIIAYKVVHP